MPQQVGATQQVLPLEHLIGAPLQAIVRAHDLMSQAAVDFLAEWGLEPPKEPPAPSLGGALKAPPAKPLPTVRLLEFQYTHPVPDADNPGLVVDTPVHVKVPLLSLLPLPSLRIDEANIDLNVRIAQVEPVEPAPEGSSGLMGAPRYRLQSAFAPRAQEAGSSTPDEANLKISIRLKKEPTPEGARLVSDLLRDSMVSRPLPGPAKAGKGIRKPPVGAPARLEGEP